MKKALSLVLVLVFSFAFFASAETTHVKVGIVGSTNEQWTDVLCSQARGRRASKLSSLLSPTT